MFKRPVFKKILARLKGKRLFIQVLAGPRQTGKTTLARQIINKLSISSHYASADEPLVKTPAWLEQQWETARIKSRNKKGLLVLDEIQKIPSWSEIVKRLWDADTQNEINLHVVILGSAPLLMQSGLSESLAGRFEIIPITHWSFPEMAEAFGWNWEQYVYFGGYPGAASLISDENRWQDYIINALIETTISRDILLLSRIDKPALMRQLFELGCQYSGQILSYQKMLGQLHDAGNTTTLAHYLQLLDGAGLITGLNKFSLKLIRQRASSPKLLVLNTALMTSILRQSFDKVRNNAELWGRVVESSIGAHLANQAKGGKYKLFYWLERNREVDFVLHSGEDIIAIEVKSSKRRDHLPGLDLFPKRFSVKRKLLIGADGIPIPEFLNLNPAELFD